MKRKRNMITKSCILSKLYEQKEIWWSIKKLSKFRPNYYVQSPWNKILYAQINSLQMWRRILYKWMHLVFECKDCFCNICMMHKLINIWNPILQRQKWSFPSNSVFHRFKSWISVRFETMIAINYLTTILRII